jgi:hypothetical protein
MQRIWARPWLRINPLTQFRNSFGTVKVVWSRHAPRYTGAGGTTKRPISRSRPIAKLLGRWYASPERSSNSYDCNNTVTVREVTRCHVNRPARALAADREGGRGRDRVAEEVPGWGRGQGRDPVQGKHRGHLPQRLSVDLFAMSYVRADARCGEAARTLPRAAGDRTLLRPAEDRTLQKPAEDRTLLRPTEASALPREEFFRSS